MNLSIFLVVDDEEDRFLLSLAFAGANLRESISFFPDSISLMNKLHQLSPQSFPDLIGMNYQASSLNNRTDLLASLKSHPQWHNIPVVLFCHNTLPRVKQKLLDNGALACLPKASLYVDYMELARTLITLATTGANIDNKHEKIAS